MRGGPSVGETGARHAGTGEGPHRGAGQEAGQGEAQGPSGGWWGREGQTTRNVLGRTLPRHPTPPPQELFDKADETNNIPAPDAVLTSLAVPDANKVSLFPLNTIRSVAPDHTPTLLPNSDADPAKGAVVLAAFERARSAAVPGGIPFATVQGDHLASEFVRLACGMDTSALTPAMRLYVGRGGANTRPTLQPSRAHPPDTPLPATSL